MLISYPGLPELKTLDFVRFDSHKGPWPVRAVLMRHTQKNRLCYIVDKPDPSGKSDIACYAVPDFPEESQDSVDLIPDSLSRLAPAGYRALWFYGRAAGVNPDRYWGPGGLVILSHPSGCWKRRKR